MAYYKARHKEYLALLKAVNLAPNELWLAIHRLNLFVGDIERNRCTPSYLDQFLVECLTIRLDILPNFPKWQRKVLPKLNAVEHTLRKKYSEDHPYVKPEPLLFFVEPTFPFLEKT
jgi:hypothetical protein